MSQPRRCAALAQDQHAPGSLPFGSQSPLGGEGLCLIPLGEAGSGHLDQLDS